MPKTLGTYTYADLAQMPSDRRFELIGGELYMVPAPSMGHQRAGMALSRRLANHVFQHKLGEVLAAPCDVILEDDIVLQPDILFVRKDHLDRIHEDGLHAAPDLVIEIISASTAHKDRVEKRAIYERYGVSELWYVDPKTQTIEVLDLANRAYRLRGIFKGEDLIESRAAEGFALKTADAFPEPIA